MVGPLIADAPAHAVPEWNQSDSKDNVAVELQMPAPDEAPIYCEIDEFRERPLPGIRLHRLSGAVQGGKKKTVG